MLSRLTVVKIFFAVWIITLIGRLFYLQVIKHDTFVLAADKQHFDRRFVEGERGKIFLKDFKIKDKYYPLATNRELFTIAISPRTVKDSPTALTTLHDLLGVATTTIQEKLDKKDDVYEVIKRSVDSDTTALLRSKNIEGIIYDKEIGRFYPEKENASHISGFLGFKGDTRVGQYGLESYYEKELQGEKGVLEAAFDAGGRVIVTNAGYIKEPEAGVDLYTTIDRTLEYYACSRLDEAVKKHGADKGSVIIMDPFTGAIFALCDAPQYDPNEYSKVKDASVFMDGAVSRAYEPGSIFKSITMAAAINEGKVTPDTTYKDEGEVKIGKYTIKNSDLKAHGITTMTQVLDESLNTGAIFAVRQLGVGLFKKYVRDFGFGETTHIDTAGEGAGNISRLNEPSDIYPATASFGQGITTTPLQMLVAYAAIVNGGYLVKPYTVERIEKSDGTVEITKPKVVRQVISAQAAHTLSAMLVSVVENGHGKKAAVKGYYIGGKTGTAQVPLASGGYDPHKTIGSFVGFGPLKNPRFVMITKLDNPKDVQFAESTAGPLFGDIARFLLDYLEVPMERSL